MAKVFVVQNSEYFNEKKGEFLPKFDLTAAQKYGELVFLLSPTAKPFKPTMYITEMEEILQEATANDYILLIGSPALIGITSVMFWQYTGCLRMLQWHGKDKKYNLIEVIN